MKRRYIILAYYFPYTIKLNYNMFENSVSDWHKPIGTNRKDMIIPYHEYHVALSNLLYIPFKFKIICSAPEMQFVILYFDKGLKFVRYNEVTRW